MNPRHAVTALAFLAGLIFAPACRAQTAHPVTPTLQIFVDTAGVSRVGDDVYVTWVFAKATPTALPSSGILVTFDCGRHMVRRLAHVVYHLAPDDSTKVAGAIEDDNGPWSTVSIPALFDLVCDVGRAHGEGDAFTAPPRPPDPPASGSSAS